MAVVSPGNGLTPKADWDSRQRDKARARPTDEQFDLTPEEQEKYKILRYCAKLFEEARKAREPHDTFAICWQMWNGDMWSNHRPLWRASITINKVRAFITFMTAVMTDNKPRISVEPLVPGSEDAADLLRKLVDRDWDENNMQDELTLFVFYGLVWGNGFMKVTYDPYANGGRGKHCVAVIPPYEIFANRNATCIEDAEYIIHCQHQTMGWVRRNFPDKAKLVWRLRGVKTFDKNDTLRDKDFVKEGQQGEVGRIISAQNINGNIIAPSWSTPEPYGEDDQDRIEIAEYWLRDDTLESYERAVVINGTTKMEPVVGKDGMTEFTIVGTKQVVSEIDGLPTSIPIRQPKMKPVMETAWRLKFPNGRLVTTAGGRILLRDIPNPYQTDGFPFAMWKDYNTGGFHAQGEPLALKSCALAINRLASNVLEILEKTGNPSFLMKKGAGVNAQQIKNKPGMLIPVEDMEAIKPLEKPPIPHEFFTLYELLANSMGEVSGVNEAMKGSMPAANTGFAAVDALQESGSAPIRLKVRNMERGIARFGKLRIQLIQQYDNGSRPLRVSTDRDPGVIDPASNINVQFRTYKNPDIQGQVEFGIVPISSLSTSPAGTWNKWMTLIDKHLVDRRWWHDKFRIEGYKTELPRMEKQEALDAAQQAAAKEKSKPGPAPKGPASKAHRARQAPPSNVPSRAQNAAVR